MTLILTKEEAIAKFSPYSLNNVDRMSSLYDLAKDVIERKVPGDMLEVGVYKGGNIMVMSYVVEMMESDKRVHAIDTFEGMTKPCKYDSKRKSMTSDEVMSKWKSGDWCCCDLIDFKKYVFRNIPYFNGCIGMGDVVDNDMVPPLLDTLSLLRIDVDFYEPTKAAMEQFYPLVTSGGYVVFDDYGRWDGARKAIDEYFELMGINSKLIKVDSSCKYMEKP